MKKILTLLIFIPKSSFAYSFMEAENLWDFITLFWAFASQAIIAIASIAFLIWIVYYIISKWDDQNVSTAKAIMTNSIVSIFIVLFAKLIRSNILNTWASDWNVSDIFAVFWKVQSFIYSAIWAIALLSIVYTAYIYMTSFWDYEKIEKAKNSLKRIFIWLALAWMFTLIISYIINLVS